MNLAGLWAWVRGGGWGGPFVKDETWIDANVFAVPTLADDPATSCDALAKGWIKNRISVTDPALAAVIHRVMDHSREVILKGFYIGPDAQGQNEPWNPNGQLIQDDLIDANEAWRIIQALAENQFDAVVREKQQAVDLLAGDRASLQRLNPDEGRAVAGPLINTLLYAESLFTTLRDLLAGLTAYRRYQGSGERASAETCRRMLFAAQSSWNHHTQRHGALPGTATSFREENFWELTQQVLDEINEVGVG